jgi:NADH-quinone oxidoreductase subunit G
MKVVVDGKTLELPAGTSAIDAVFAAGGDVPYFCSQPYMSPIGACRMCLARVGAPRRDRDGSWIQDEATGAAKIFWFPNLMATCTTAVMEGMVIDTTSKPVKAAQNAMVEFTLANHPLDCPVCDKGGACELQDRAYEYGEGISRFAFTKRHQEKHHALSPLITLDRERCIHCKRCVRYFEEVPGDEVLDFIERGGHTHIGTADAGLPSPFTGNITDICPVGALLDTTSRFRGRNWEYHHTATTSLDDASGSAIVVDGRTGRIERIKAGHHPNVNKTWIDDATRFGHEYVDAPDRLRRPLVRRGDALVEATWEEAFDVVAQRLRAIDPKQVGVAIRADATLEEGAAALSLAQDLGSAMVDHAPRPAGGVIAPVPHARLDELATAAAILVVGDATEEVPIVDLRIKDALKGVTPPSEFEHGAPIADLRLKERMPRKREILTVAAPYRVDLMRHAGRVATLAPSGEGAFLRALTALAEGRAADAAALGMSLSDANATVAGLRAAANAVVVVGGFVLADPAATEAAYALCRAVNAKPLPLAPMANGVGLERAGVLPKQAPAGYPQMLERARGLFLSNLDPAVEAAAAERLAGLDLLVVHTSFLTATARLAHVVLPAATGYEKEGTVVNVEGRMLGVHPAPVDGGESRDFTGVVKAYGEALGRRLEGRSVKSARRLLKHLGVDLDALPERGAFPPFARPAARPLRAAAPAAGALRVPTMVRPDVLHRNPHLLAATGGLALRLHPDDAARRDLADGDHVTVSVSGVVRPLTVRVDAGVPAGLATLPATPDEPIGPAAIDWATLTVSRRALEVA